MTAAGAQPEFDDLPLVGLSIVVSQHGTTITLALEGDWDLAEQQRMADTVADVLACQPDRVVLDLSRLNFMDSSGIHGVIELARHAARLNIGLTVIPGPRAVRRLFELCQMSGFLTFIDSA